MKLKYLISVYLLASLALISCEESYDLFPDSSKQVIAVGGDNMVDISMNTTQDKVTNSILVLKGGGKPSTTTDATLRVMSLEEACEEWGYNENEIAILPEGTFSLEQHLSIDRDSNHVYTKVTFYPVAIYKALHNKPNAKWVLPLQLASRTDTVFSNSSFLMYQCTVTAPKAEWAFDDKNEEVTFRTDTLPLPIVLGNITDNGKQFTCTINADKADSLVQAYNVSHGTSYEPLPTAAYTLSEVTISQGQVQSHGNLILTRDGMTPDHTYLLPLRVTTDNEGLEATDEVRYITVTNPSVCYQAIDHAKMSIAFCNSQQPEPNAAYSMIDGDETTYWRSRIMTTTADRNRWLASAIEDDYIYPDDDGLYVSQAYGLNRKSWGEHSPGCYGIRRSPNITIVIDLGHTATISGVRLAKLTALVQTIKTVEFSVADKFSFKTIRDGGTKANYDTADNGNLWKPLFTMRLPMAIGTYRRNVETMSQCVRGRFLRLRGTGTYASSAYGDIGCSELYVTEVVSVNGYPFNGQ